MRIQGYKHSNADHTLFIRSNGPLSTFLIVYVDDIVVTGSDTTEIARLKCALGMEFEIKDLGQLRYFLGIEVAHSSKGVFLSQRKYTLDLLSETGILGSKPVDTPLDASQDSSQGGGTCGSRAISKASWETNLSFPYLS